MARPLGQIALDKNHVLLFVENNKTKNRKYNITVTYEYAIQFILYNI